MKLITSFSPCTVRFKRQMIVRAFYALLTFIFICANATAQVSERISFDKESKKITITLINNYDTHSSIRSGISYAPFPTDNCWYKVWWKDKDSTVVDSIDVAWFYEKYIDSILFPKTEKSFTFNLTPRTPKAKSVEIFIHFGVYTIIGKKINYWEKTVTKVYDLN